MSVFRAPISPGQSWFTTVGGGLVPAAAGTIKTYLAGTLTPAATFADSSGSTPNPTTIVLNSQGRLPSIDVWLSGGVAYRFVIADALGNPIADVDNLTGENDPAFAAGSFGQWITGPAPTYLSATSFSCDGDQVSLGPLNLDRRLEITSGAGVTNATITSSVYNSGTNKTTVTFDKDAADSTPTNPMTGLRYGLLSVPDTSFPSAALALGQPRRRAADSTNVGLYGPIGSNLQVFTVLTSGATAANVLIASGTVDGVAASALFSLGTAAGVQPRHGEPFQINGGPINAPLAIGVTYIASVQDATHIGVYAVPAGWIYTVPLLNPTTNRGGLAWGNPIAFAAPGANNITVQCGWVAPPGVTRTKSRLNGGGGGGGGVAATDGTHLFGGGGGGAGSYQEGWHTVNSGAFLPTIVGAGGAGGAAGSNAGTAGGQTSFNGATCGGGGGGGGSGVAVNAVPGTGGVSGSQLPISCNGAAGSAGVSGSSGLAIGVANSGMGASSAFGGGAIAATYIAASPGFPGGAPGAGGSGASNAINSAAQSGGAGANGIIVLEW